MEHPIIAANIDPYNKGVVVYSEGDLLTAFKIWKTLADAGYIHAQFSLSKMHNQGESVSQDYTEAVKWYRLAAK